MIWKIIVFMLIASVPVAVLVFAITHPSDARVTIRHEGDL